MENFGPFNPITQKIKRFSLIMKSNVKLEKGKLKNTKKEAIKTTFVIVITTASFLNLLCKLFKKTE